MVEGGRVNTVRNHWWQLALGASLLSLAWGWSSLGAQEPLRITLSAPAICEQDWVWGGAAAYVTVQWQVSGGQSPYEVMINGELYDDVEGRLDVFCSSQQPGARTSGPITIQATVTDGAGQQASALADIYALLVLNSAPFQADEIAGGETYRVHQVILTLPSDSAVRVGGYLSADCASRGPDCDDRFALWYRAPGDARSSSLWIRRWTRTEHSRTLVGESYKTGDIDVETLSFDQRRANQYFDDLFSLVGQAPRQYQVTTPRVGPDDPQLELKLYAPTYCLTGLGQYQPKRVDVSWEVLNGRGPYEVTIAGQRYMGRTGRVEVLCSAGPRVADGGHQRLQGTVVDADGRIDSGRVDMYAIGWTHQREDGSFAGLPHRLHDLVMIYPPEWGESVTLVDDGLAGEYHNWTDSDGRNRSEESSRYTFTDGDTTASFLIGNHTGTVYERTPREEASAALNVMFDKLLGSLGQAPALPEGFVESNAPLELSAFLVPTVCEISSNGYGDSTLYWTARGGRWWPLQVEVLGNVQRSSPTGLRCQNLRDANEVVIQVSDYGSGGNKTELRLPIITRQTDFENASHFHATLPSNFGALLPERGYCVTGERFTLQPSPYNTSPISEVSLHDGRDSWRGGTDIECPSRPGWLRITREIQSSRGPERTIYSSFVLPVQQARPERTAQ